ncbi:single-stranded DNA-binding protein [Fusobacterium sp. SYSU M8D902]|uniref:single-stranded DNA-binding protein n=1 Tax=Fusobacterium sp. SYSU M8D902 TaxID=3159562 RepID=UPI0032E3B7DD
MNLDVNELLEIAKKEVENLKTDEIFLVKELFKGYEWNRIDRKTRLLLGILFLNWVRTTNEDKIKIIEKTSSGQQKYKII